MGRPRKWGSDAERMAAARGNGAEPEDVEPVLPVVTSDELQRRAASAPDLEEYVAREVAITRRQLELAAAGSSAARARPADAAEVDDAGRLERTEKYARWRYAGYLAGEIDRL